MHCLFLRKFIDLCHIRGKLIQNPETDCRCDINNFLFPRLCWIPSFPPKKDILFLTRQKGYTSGTSHSIRICSHSFPIFALLNGKLSLSMFRRKQSPIQHNTYGRIKTFKCMNGGCCIGSQQVYIFICIAYSKNRLPSSKLMPFPRKLWTMCSLISTLVYSKKACPIYQVFHE